MDFSERKPSLCGHFLKPFNYNKDPQWLAEFAIR